jgi:hypothetical protein
MATALPPNSTDNPIGEVQQYRKPKADLYTLLLGIALAAILIAILFLFLETKDYEGKLKENIPTSMITFAWEWGRQLLSFFG